MFFNNNNKYHNDLLWATGNIPGDSLQNSSLQNKAQLCSSMLGRPWRLMYGNLIQGPKNCRRKSLLFGEQRSKMVGKVCSPKYVLDVSDDSWGNCFIAAQ